MYYSLNKFPKYCATYHSNDQVVYSENTKIQTFFLKINIKNNGHLTELLLHNSFVIVRMCAKFLVYGSNPFGITANQLNSKRLTLKMKVKGCKIW